MSTILQESKKLKFSNNIEVNAFHSPKGFIWNNLTYSCAFDSLFTILLYNIKHSSHQWTSVNSNISEPLQEFIYTFTNLEETDDNLTQGHNELHNKMSQWYPNSFNMTSYGNDVQEFGNHIIFSVRSLEKSVLYRRV